MNSTTSHSNFFEKQGSDERKPSLILKLAGGKWLRVLLPLSILSLVLTRGMPVIARGKLPRDEKFSNSLGMNMVRLPGGQFNMGGTNGDFDERPVHDVEITQPYYLADREVTWAQFEKFDPEHKAYRGRDGTAAGDDDPALFVSWQDAMRFCEWLGKKEGHPCRLPTEAEWELVGRTQPELLRTAAKVENWCMDWYGPYDSGAAKDPSGYTTGSARVTRGGDFRATNGIPNATNRHSDIPEDRNRVVGFRVAIGEIPNGTQPPPRPIPRWAARVSQNKHEWKPDVDMSKPWFAEPMPYVKIPPGMHGPLFEDHDHDPGLTWCPNGDLLAIWYSTVQESGRELVIAASRLQFGSKEWELADLFWDVADRNDHAPALLTTPGGRIYHWNGLGVTVGWRELALVQRTSDDNGATWSAPRIIQPDHGLRNMPVPSPIVRGDGALCLTCDAHFSGSGGTALHISTDGGMTWTDPGRGKPIPDFRAGSTGDWIAGIHAQVAEWTDGSLVAVGRGNDIDGHMPMSVSHDGGKTWTYSATPFPPIGGGQRAVLKHLREGPLMLISFAGKGMEFTDAKGHSFAGRGMFAALSEDGGKTWPVRKLLTDGKRRELNGYGWTHQFVMDQTQAEPKGYLTGVQTPDGIIQLISSGIHYRFNLAWLREPASSVDGATK